MTTASLRRPTPSPSPRPPLEQVESVPSRQDFVSQELRACSRPYVSGVYLPCSVIFPRPQSDAVLPARSAAESREVQADENDHRGSSAPGQVHPPGDLTDGEGPPGGAQRGHHQDHQVGAPEASWLESQGQGWSACCVPRGGREIPGAPSLSPLQRAWDFHSPEPWAPDIYKGCCLPSQTSSCQGW